MMYDKKKDNDQFANATHQERMDYLAGWQDDRLGTKTEFIGRPAYDAGIRASKANAPRTQDTNGNR